MTATRRGLAGSAAVMFSGTLVSRLLGLIRNILLVAAIGVTGAANSFAVANRLPNIIYMLVAGGVLNAILVPQIVRAMKSRDGGQEYVNRLLTMAGGALFGLTVLLTAGAGVLVTIYASELQPQWFTLAVAFALWCIPQIFFYGMYTLLGQVLNARGIFGPFMWAPAVNNVVAIIGLVAYIIIFGPAATGAHLDPEAWTALRTAVIGGTATLGVAAQAAVLVVPLRRAGFRFRPRWGLRGSGLGRASRVGTWAFASLAVAQFGFIAISNLAAGAAGREAAGGVFVPGNAAWDNAFFLYMLPQSLITVSLVTALFTRVSDAAADQDVIAVREDMSLALRTIAVFTLFAGPGLAVLGLPLVQSVLPTTTLAEAEGIARVLVPLVLGIPALGAFTMIQRVYYAFEDTRSLFRIQVPLTVMVILGCLATTVLPATWWLVGAGVATTLSNVVGSVWSYLGLRRKLPSLDGGRVLRTHIRLSFAVVPPLVVGWLLLSVVGPTATAEAVPLRLAQAMLRVVGVGGVMLVGYLLALRALEVRELQTIASPASRLLHRMFQVLPAPIAGLATRVTNALLGTPSPRTISAEASTSEAPGMAPRSGTLDADRAELESTLSTGVVLGARYRLLRPGPGGLPGAASWIGHDAVLDRDVLLLVLSAGHPQAEEVLDAARRASLVEDSRLQRILDVGRNDEVAWIVSDLLTGPSLAEVCADGPLDPPQARAVIGELASAVDNARQRGVHHLALSPSLVFLSPTGQITLSGLGTAAALLDVSGVTGPAGVPGDGPGLVRLLYLTLTGHWPQEAEDPADEIRQADEVGSRLPVAPETDGVVISPADLNPDLPHDLVSLCEATLIAGHGPHSSTELIRDLAPWPEIVPPQAIGASAASPDEPPTPPAESAESVPAAQDAATSPDAEPATPTHGLDTSQWRPPAFATREAAPRSFSEVITGDGEPQPSVRHHRGKLTGAAVGAAIGGIGAAIASTAKGAVNAIQQGAKSTQEALTRATEQRRSERAAQEAQLEEQRREADVAAALAAVQDAPVEPTATPAASPTSTPGAEPAPVPPTPAPMDPPPAAPSSYPSADELFPSFPEEGEVPFTQRRINPTPVVLGFFVVIVLLATILAIRTLGADPDPSRHSAGVPTTPAATATPTTPEPQPTQPTPTEEPTPELPAPVIANLVPLDPEGDGAENPELTPRALDGDPSTFWRSRSYVDPAYGMKSGIGLAVSFEEESLVSAVTIDLMGHGGNVEIRATDPATPTDGEVLAEGPMGPDTIFTFEEPLATDGIVLWFTHLPVADSDGKNRIELAELRVE